MVCADFLTVRLTMGSVTEALTLDAAEAWALLRLCIRDVLVSISASPYRRLARRTPSAKYSRTHDRKGTAGYVHQAYHHAGR